jgi:hypothetical protein
MAETGQPLAVPETFRIAANGRIELDAGRLGLPQGEGTVRAYGRITGNGLNVVGYVNTGFGGNPSRAVELIRPIPQALIFPVIHAGDAESSGLALLNPGSSGAAATVELHSGDGTVQDAWTNGLPPESQHCALLEQYFPQLLIGGRQAGHIVIRAEQEPGEVGIEGKQDLSTTVSLPPQVLP